MTPSPRPRTHPFAGSGKARQEAGDPGHCEPCARYGHAAAHPHLGCGDAGCHARHGDSEPADEAGRRALAEDRRSARRQRTRNHAREPGARRARTTPPQAAAETETETDLR